jgi:flagellin
MRIQHNIMAMNAYRNYNTNTSALSGNLEKLSSGYKINRAGDDAAGLAISEKMRAQISGLEQASSNVKDGISLVKTGEGAMQEIQDMLNRMVTLATQSANGTYDDSVDRANLQKEVDNLQSEINRIADSANFNGISLLDGSLETGSASVTEGSMIDLLPKIGETLGTDTVLHKDVTAPTTGTTFSIDLGNLQWTASSTANTLKITVGKSVFTVAATTAKTYAASDIASLAAAAIKTVGSFTAVDGKVFTVKATQAATAADMVAVTSSNNQIVFTQETPPTAEDNVLTAPSDVDITNDGGAIGKAVDNGQDYSPAVVAIKNVTLDDAARLGSTSFQLTAKMASDGATLTFGDTTYTFTADAAQKGSGGHGSGQTIYVGDLDLSTDEGLAEAANRLTEMAASDTLFAVGHDGSKVTLLERNNMTAYTTTSPDYKLDTKEGWEKALSYKTSPSAGKALTLQIGDTSDNYNQLTVSVNDMHTTSLGINGIDISTQEGAQEAIDKIKTAINNVSSTRGDLGAIQNRLEHTANNLSVMTENIQDAESTIRDTDIAEEMMSYTKNNILVQSAQAMLAQANTVPQGVLQLLQ